MKMNAFDALVILILQNIESKIESVAEKAELLQFGLDILPYVQALSKELVGHYSEKFEICLGALNLLNEDDDARSVRVHTKYDFEYLKERPWFSEKTFEFYKNSFCYPETTRLHTYEEVIILAEQLSSQEEYAESFEED